MDLGLYSAMLDSRPLLLDTDFPPVYRNPLTTLQVNLGYLCNLSCAHCHVNAGPHRKEVMNRSTVSDVLAALERLEVSILDLTGGAPELNPHFRLLVEQARQLGVHVMDRCNLTVLMEPGQEQLAEFLAANGVEVVASLPCYLKDNVDAQRGRGVFDKSIEAIRRLNALGYGQSGVLKLNLVYNPQGATLPPPQRALETDYKTMLAEEFGIYFDQLFSITNMPIKRFGAVLLARGEYQDYMRLLKDNFSAANLEAVMCRSLISVDWRGYLYDCDFNQMLDLPVIASDGNRMHLADLERRESLTSDRVVTGEHCYGCTAGQGSSCGGAL